MTWKVVCPRNPLHFVFSVTAHVSEDWKVDEHGNFLDRIATIETIHAPDSNDMYWCIACKDEAQVVHEPVITKNEMSEITKALTLAAEVHQGQEDKTGAPYIYHPLRVMLKGVTCEERIVGLLHDVLEDGGGKVSRVQLLALFGEVITNAIHAITRLPDEEYKYYILRCKQNALARTVKGNDLEDNLAPWRLNRLDEKTRNRLRTKYAMALHLLATD